MRISISWVCNLEFLVNTIYRKFGLTDRISCSIILSVIDCLCVMVKVRGQAVGLSADVRAALHTLLRLYASADLGSALRGIPCPSAEFLISNWPASAGEWLGPTGKNGRMLVLQWECERFRWLFVLSFCIFRQFSSNQHNWRFCQPSIREYSATSKPLSCKGYREKAGVLSARFFTGSISKPLHLTNCHLYMRAGMDHAFPIFPCFDKVIKPVLGSFPRFCPQLSFEQGCGVPPKYAYTLLPKQKSGNQF